MKPRIGSLCSGYGGLEMGLAVFTGGEAVWHVEYDKYPAVILAERFPGVPNYGDVTATDWTKVEPVDWLTAGYPCQPFSHAGKRKGSDDERHLWPFVADAIGALRPRGVLLENVAGHVSLGLDRVLWDLAALGYVGRYGVVRASDAGAPHGRARIFIAATDAERLRESGRRGLGDVGGAAAGGAAQGLQRERHRDASDDRGSASPVAAPWDTDSENGSSLRGVREGESAQPSGVRTAAGPDIAWGTYEPAIHRWERVTGRSAPRPTEPARSGERLSPVFVEWLMGLPDGWVTAVPGIPRNAQLKALGNGCVPQQVELALRLLLPSVCGVAA